MTGIVEPNGVVRKSVHLGWSELPLKTEVENATGVPVIVGNDTNAALVAERFFGDCSPNSMLISIGRGVGAALCLNDVIIEGSSFTAGENRTRGGRPERANLRMRQTGMSRIIRFR